MNKLFEYIVHPGRSAGYDEIRKYEIRDSLRISRIVCPVVSFAVIVFLLMSFLWPQSYGDENFLGLYRASYIFMLISLLLYEIGLVLINIYFDVHYKKIPSINVVAAAMLLTWSAWMTYLNHMSYHRVDTTLFMIISFCIPFCLYLDIRIYLLLMAAADLGIVRIFLIDGVDSAFNESNLGDFIVFIVIQFILGIAVIYFKHMMRSQILKEEKRRKEVNQLSQAQNRFFSNMSHEIRTPINTIIGLNEMILRENVSEEINEDAENIQAASRMLLNLINDILDMSKFESGQMELNTAAYQTGDMFSEIVAMLWIRAKEKNLDFKIEISPDLPSELYGDEMRIKQILINVLNNAIKYTDKGMVRLSVACRRDGDGTAEVTYSVTDTGMGIKKESIPYLFTAFKRVDEDKNRYIEGTGLGLSIVKQLVDLMGGTISVNSVYTKGSTFVIMIPQRIADDKSVGKIVPGKRHRDIGAHQYTDAFKAEKARILVVDDTSANLLVVRKLLKGTGMQIDTAISGSEALKKTLEQYYHVILMDHKMPGMDGVECMHAIRNQTGGLCRESMIIALTANAGSEMAGYYEREGFVGYLTKPVSGDDLEKTIYRFLPKDIVTMTAVDEELAKESLAWISDNRKKKAVAVTTESIADIPAALLEKYDIHILPHMVRTSDGLFKDGLEIETNGLLAYMEDETAVVETVSPTVLEHEGFFSGELDRAGSIIHVSISAKVAHSGCPAAMEAAAGFGNVTVIDSGQLSSGQGLMAIEAARLALDGHNADSIAKSLEKMRPHIHTSFIVDTLSFLARQGQVSQRVARLAQAFMIHPVLSLKKGDMVVSGVFFGTRERAWESYIRKVFNVPGTIDRRMLFITYVGMTGRELDMVREMAQSQMEFEEVYFQKASPAIASNCGPGTFGLLFFTEYDGKKNKSDDD